MLYLLVGLTTLSLCSVLLCLLLQSLLIVSQAFFWCLFAWNIFSILSLSVCVCLTSKVSLLQAAYRWILVFFIHLATVFFDWRIQFVYIQSSYRYVLLVILLIVFWLLLQFLMSHALGQLCVVTFNRSRLCERRSQCLVRSTIPTVSTIAAKWID